MTGYAATRRMAAAFVLVALVVLAAPAMAQTADEQVGWERTSVTTGQPGGGQGSTSTSTVQPAGPGWESTSVSTGDSPSVATNGEPVSSTSAASISTGLLYLIGLLAAAIIAVMAAVLLRPHSRPRGVA